MQISNGLLVRGLRDAGHSVELHILGRNSKTIIEKSYMEVGHPFAADRLSGHLKVANLFFRQIRSKRPDLVVLLDESIVRVLGLLFFKIKFSAPIVSINSGSTVTRRNVHLKGLLNAWLVRRGYSFLERLFVADATAEVLGTRHPYLTAKIRRLGRPIPPEFFHVTKSPLAWPNINGLPIIMSSGRASADKGIDIVLRALAELRDASGKETVEYWYIGSGPELGSWRALAEELKLSKVRFLGYVEFRNLHKYYSQAHFFILPSRGEMETFGRVWVEALAASKPVISTRLDNLSNIIFDGKNGFLVDPTVDSIAGSLQRCLMLSKLEYLNMAEAAHQSVLQYSLSSVIEKFTEELEIFNPGRQLLETEN